MFSCHHVPLSLGPTTLHGLPLCIVWASPDYWIPMVPLTIVFRMALIMGDGHSWPQRLYVERFHHTNVTGVRGLSRFSKPSASAESPRSERTTSDLFNSRTDPLAVDETTRTRERIWSL